MAGTRGVQATRLGNIVEAYPPGGEAQVGFWADVVYEGARVERTVDSGGNGTTTPSARTSGAASGSPTRRSAPSHHAGTAVEETAAPLGEGQ